MVRIFFQLAPQDWAALLRSHHHWTLMRWALTEWEKWEILSAMAEEIGFLGESSIKKRDNFGRGFVVMEQIENVLPFPFSGGKGGDAGRPSERDRTFSALLSTDMSGFHIAPAVFAFNFVKRLRQKPLSQTWLIRSPTAGARQLFDLENN